jgi:hypothetical protein
MGINSLLKHVQTKGIKKCMAPVTVSQTGRSVEEQAYINIFTATIHSTQYVSEALIMPVLA